MEDNTWETRVLYCHSRMYAQAMLGKAQQAATPTAQHPPHEAPNAPNSQGDVGRWGWELAGWACLATDKQWPGKHVPASEVLSIPGRDVFSPGRRLTATHSHPPRPGSCYPGLERCERVAEKHAPISACGRSIPAMTTLYVDLNFFLLHYEDTNATSSHTWTPRLQWPWLGQSQR